MEDRPARLLDQQRLRPELVDGGMAKWKLDADVVAEIRCPTLITAAESDLASSNAKELFDALTCPKSFIHFSDDEGAGDHCEIFNRSMANRKILDWLDDTLTR